MLSELEILCPESASGVHTRIRCICHILNLVVKVSFEYGQPTFSRLTLTIFSGYFIAVHGQTTSGNI